MVKFEKKDYTNVGNALIVRIVPDPDPSDWFQR